MLLKTMFKDYLAYRGRINEARSAVEVAIRSERPLLVMVNCQNNAVRWSLHERPESVEVACGENITGSAGNTRVIASGMGVSPGSVAEDFKMVSFDLGNPPPRPARLPGEGTVEISEEAFQRLQPEPGYRDRSVDELSRLRPQLRPEAEPRKGFWKNPTRKDI